MPATPVSPSGKLRSIKQVSTCRVAQMARAFAGSLADTDHAPRLLGEHHRQGVAEETMVVADEDVHVGAFPDSGT